MCRTNRYHLLAILILVLLPGRGLFAAAFTDSDQPIHLQADRVVIEEKKGRSRYEGHVELRQGRLVIRSQSMTMHKRNEKLDYFEARGTPAYFDRGETAHEAALHGEAKTIEYSIQKGVITLRGDAVLDQAGGRFSGEEIVYDTVKATVKAAGKKDEKDGDGRVHVIIQPQEAPLGQ